MAERKAVSGHKKFFIVYFALLIVILTALGIMRWLGYYLIEANLEFILFGLLICSALVALTFFLTRRIYSKWLKILMGCLGIGITFIAAVAMISVFKLVITLSVPAYYNSFISPSGKTAVVLRQYSAVLAAERTEGEPQGVYEELGFSYTAYPKAAMFFYDADKPGEGMLEIGCTSDAQLMYEWMDDSTLHLFIDRAQIGDTGEHFLKFE